MSTFLTARIRRTTAVALLATAVAAPVAGARPSDGHFNTPDQGSSAAADEFTPKVTRTIDDGFDPGSAAIGAAAVLFLTAGVSTVSHSHQRLGRRSARA